MIKKLSESTADVLGYEISEKVTEADYEILEPEIDAAVATYGSVRLLFVFTAMVGIELSAIDNDLRIGLEHRDDIERIAIVSDSAVYAWLTASADYLIGIEAAHFAPRDLAAAWAWINERY